MITALRVARNTLSRWFRNPYTTLIFAGLLTIPLLYGGTLVWAFWDPIGRANSVPVAIVNLDESVTSNGQKVDAGREIVKTLLDQKQLDWSETSAEEAAAGLQAKKYYAYLTIPKDFSAKLATADTSKPKQATMTLTSDDAINYLVGVLSETAVGAAQGQGNTTVQERVLKRIYSSLGVAEGDAKKAIDGVEKLAGGTKKAADASKQLASGAQEVATGNKDLATAVGKAVDAVDTVGNEVLDRRSDIRVVASTVDDIDSAVRDITGTLTTIEQAAAQGDPQAAQTAAQLISDLETEVLVPLQAIQEVDKGFAALVAQATPLIERIASDLSGVDAFVDDVREIQDALDRDVDLFATDLAALCAEFPSDRCTAVQESYNVLIRDEVDALTEVVDGSTDLLDSITTDAAALPGVLNQVADDLQTVATNLSGVESEVRTIAGELQDLEARVQRTLPPLAQSLEGVTTTLSGDVQAPLDEIASRADALASGQSVITRGVGDVESAVKDADSKITELASGSEQVASGAGELSSALVTEIAPGTEQLASSVKNAADNAPGIVNADQKDFTTVLSSPIKVDRNILNSVPKFGDGFAPYFVPLALWVGALVVLLFVPPLNIAGRMSGMPAWKVALGSFAPLALVGFVQTTVLWAALKFGLGLVTASPIWLYASLLVSSLAFLAIIQLLKATFGLIGDGLAVALLVLQVTGDEGAYPIPTFPELLQWLHPYLPMSFSVDAIRRSTASTDIQPYVSQDLLILFLFGLVSVTLTGLVARTRRNATTDEVKPLIFLN